MGDRCTGHCCRRFFLQYYTHGIVSEQLAALERGQDPDNAPEGTLIAGRWMHDYKIILPMLVPLEDVPETTETSEAGGFYTCKHFDAASGNCANYEGRPRMCRDYPYGRRCGFKDCTWTEARRIHLPVVNTPASIEDDGSLAARRLYPDRETCTARPLGRIDRIDDGPVAHEETCHAACA